MRLEVILFICSLSLIGFLILSTIYIIYFKMQVVEINIPPQKINITNSNGN